MNPSAYRSILLLLGSCIILILILQAFWLSNLYEQEKRELDRLVYAALEDVRQELQEREKVEDLKHTIIIDEEDTIARTPSRDLRISSHTFFQVHENDTEITISEGDTLDKSARQIQRDSVLFVGRNKKINIFVHNSKNNRPLPATPKRLNDHKPAEISELLKKMILEIKLLDTDRTNADTLHSTIRAALSAKGVFSPIEFSLQKKKGDSVLVLSQSTAFNKEEFSYILDLDAKRVFNRHETLLLQLKNTPGQVLAGMQRSFLLSGLLSFIIIAIFYFTVRLIARQKKLSEIKNDFVNNMTHELKTPIATISLAIDAMQKHEVRHNNQRFAEYSRILKEENNKLNTHVESVLQLALLEKSELRFNKTRVDLVHLISGVLKGFALQAQSQEAELHFTAPAGSLPVYADETHLHSAVSNLIDNALKYGGKNTTIKIELSETSHEAVIRVRDNGKGISEKDQEKIFDKFFRAQNSMVHDVKGFGLGLSYVRSIVVAHGGSISVVSSAGKGAEFTIKLRKHV